MCEQQIRTVRSVALVAATVLLGISLTFAFARIHTTAYPLLWAAAMPLLGFYYFSGSSRWMTWKHLPAAAMALYAVVLWQVAKGYGSTGMAATAGGVLASVAAAWLGGRFSRPGTAAAAGSGQAPPVRRDAPVALGSGVARRRRLRVAGSHQGR